jgi:hypothetical protein
MLAAAAEWARHHWPVFPTWGKVPAIRGAHRPRVTFWGPCVETQGVIRDALHGTCRGGCGKLGHGVWDATTDLEVVAEMWSGRRADCNVSCRIPDKLLMIDIDPRHGGDRSWRALLARHGSWPECEIHISGRGDGGAHLWVRRPPGRLTDARLGRGVEIKHQGGAAVLPPSLHDQTRHSYIRIDGPLPCPPDWFVELITMPPPPRRSRPLPRTVHAPSVADAYCGSVSWHDVLEPHGWECLDDDGDDDGARWLHPDATSSCSATVRYDGEVLFVYSTSTPFEPTSAGEPHGYTKFRAFAVLNYCGDMSAAARAIKEGRLA